MVELFSKLAARLPAADHPHRPRWEGVWIPIFLGSDLVRVTGQAFRAGRSVGALISAGCDDNAARFELSRWARGMIAIAVCIDRGDRTVLLHGRVEGIGPRLEVADELRQRHEPVRIGSGIRR